jgi:hypothetical protein
VRAGRLLRLCGGLPAGPRRAVALVTLLLALPFAAAWVAARSTPRPRLVAFSVWRRACRAVRNLRDGVRRLGVDLWCLSGDLAADMARARHARRLDVVAGRDTVEIGDPRLLTGLGMGEEILPER